MLRVVNAIAYRGTPVQVEGKRQWNIVPGVPWDVNSNTVVDFVQKANKKIDGGAKEYSTFRPLGPATSPRELPLILQSYLGTEQTSEEFERFHNNYTQHKLKSNLRKSNLSEGAVIVFIHYQILTDRVVVLDQDGQEIPEETVEPELVGSKFSMLMVRNTGALKFTDDLQIDSTDVIDLKQFVQGFQIDLNRFEAHDHNSELIDNYILLIKGSADVRDYFKEAIYAVSGASNKQSSEQLKIAFYDFCAEYEDELDRDVKDILEAKLYSVSEEYKKQPVTLEFISAALDECIPAELEQEHQLRGKFLDFANEGDYEINDEFEITSSITHDFKFVDLDVDIGILKLTKAQIGVSADETRDIHFDEETNELSIKTTLTEQKHIDAIRRIIG
ncbi:nucleoid-associated protein [Vibrio splendidus]